MGPLRPLARAARDRWVELTAYGALLRGRPAPAVRFVIVSAGRAGSHLLVSLLNSHPDLYCHNDRFLLDRGRLSPYGLLDGLGRSRGGHCFGTQLPAHRIVGDPVALFERLHHEGWRFIHLKRDNLLRQSISALIAKQRGRYHLRRGEPLPSQSVTLDPEALVRKMRRKAALLAHEEKVLDPFPRLELCYERDLVDPECHQPTANLVFQWLGLPEASVGTTLVKTGPADLSLAIANYGAIVHAVRLSPFERFLHDG